MRRIKKAPLQGLYFVQREALQSPVMGVVSQRVNDDTYLVNFLGPTVQESPKELRSTYDMLACRWRFFTSKRQAREALRTELPE